MTCEELRPDYLLYAMGALDEPASQEVRAHLERGCTACVEGVRQAEAIAFSMGAVAPGPEPPRALRGRVLAIARAEELPARQERIVKRAPFWARPMPAWQGLALAMGCLVVALTPAIVWQRELAVSHAKQAVDGAQLAREQRSAASLREQISRMEGDAALRAIPIFALELERGARAAEPLKQLAIPPGATAVALALPPDLVHQASAAELRSETGAAVWSVSPLPAGDAEAMGLTIPVRLLPAGTYVVVLRAGERTVGRLPFRVVR